MCWVLLCLSYISAKLVENRLFAYADDSTLLAVVRKPADRPAVAAAFNRDMALGFRSGAITGART